MLDSSRLDNCWLAIQVRPGWELRTAKALHTSGYEEFVPMYEQKREWSHRIRIVNVPLFTGYVFFRFQAQNVRPVVLIPGVIRFVGMGNSPTPIDPSEIESLKIAYSAKAHWEPYYFLELGATVEVQNGPLLGLKGHLVRFKNKSRLIININLIRKSVFVEINEHDVRPIHDLNAPIALCSQDISAADSFRINQYPSKY